MRDFLKRLLEWEAMMGGFEAHVFAEARQLLRQMEQPPMALEGRLSTPWRLEGCTIYGCGSKSPPIATVHLDGKDCSTAYRLARRIVDTMNEHPPAIIVVEVSGGVATVASPNPAHAESNAKVYVVDYDNIKENPPIDQGRWCPVAIDQYNGEPLGGG